MKGDNMSKVRIWSLLLAAVLMVIVVAGISAKQTTDKPEIKIRQLEPQTVLYTIYRGGYDKMSKAIGGLYALAGQRGIHPQGQMSCVYLNNPGYISAEHCLTEIRIPVAKEALKYAGTLGEMTDIKELRAMEVAVIIKRGMQVDYAALYKGLYDGIAKKGYRASDDAWESFLGEDSSGDYTQMRSEIMVPVEKLP
jgi:effector-binding domain-containing protein